MNGNEKIKDARISTDGRFLSWLDNYWYHYKWVTIIVLFFVIVLSVCTLQMCKKEKTDIILVYAGGAYLSSESADTIKSVFDAVMPEDFDGDGMKSSKFINYEIYSSEQIKDIESQTGVDGKNGYVDKSYNSSNYDNFYNYIQTGDSSVCLVDPWMYENLKANNRLMSVSEVLGYTPEGCDGYGVALGETGLYQSYAALKSLPENTVICLLRPLVVGNSSDEKYYKNECDMFKALLEYSE